MLVRIGDAGPGAVAWLVNIAGPWLVLAFIAGWLARTWRAGLVALVAAVLTKYLVQLGQGEIGTRSFALRLFAWGAAAIAAGAVCGWLGERRTPLLLGAALVLEPVLFFAGAVHGESAQLRYRGQPAAVGVLVAECVVGAAFGLADAGRRRRRLQPPKA